MVNFPGRNGRRRRVLNDEVLSASTSLAARRAASDDSASQAPRYSEAAGVENHPQITDFVPRRYRTIGMLVMTGFASAATLAGLQYCAPTIAARTGLAGTRAFDLGAPGSLASWVSAIVLMVASAACMLIYSIRRHRIDDYRGRYRVWFLAGIACVVLSASSVAGLQHVLANVSTHFTGWSALRGGAAWWLLIAGAPLAWIAARTLFDVKECGLSATMLVAAFGCYVVAAVSHLGFVRALEPPVETIVSSTAKLLGDWLVLAAATTYARYVVLDAQGLVTVRLRAKKKSAPRPKAARETKSDPEGPTVLSVANYTRKPMPAPPITNAKAWVDGSRPERDSYDDDSDDEMESSSKLSKSDRKRLRKLKAQNRAA